MFHHVVSDRPLYFCFVLIIFAFAGESLSTSASELRFLGCVADNVKQNLLSSTCVEKVVDVSRSLCMLYCGAKGSPLALVDASSTCICGRATQR